VAERRRVERNTSRRRRRCRLVVNLNMQRGGERRAKYGIPCLGQRLHEIVSFGAVFWIVLFGKSWNTGIENFGRSVWNFEPEQARA
jgi:hypothetical protein